MYIHMYHPPPPNPPHFGSHMHIYIYIYIHHTPIVGMQQLWDRLPCATWRGLGTRSKGTFPSNSAGETLAPTPVGFQF